MSSPTDRESEVRRTLGNYKIVDAKQPFRFVSTVKDAETAVQKDPHNCALARAIERYTGVKAIAIYHTVAYIPFDKKGDGEQVIERFSIDAGTRRAIEKFDETGEFAPGEYFFNPPSKTQRLGALKKISADHRARQKILGTRLEGKKPAANPRYLSVRNGTGQVAFTQLKK